MSQILNPKGNPLKGFITLSTDLGSCVALLPCGCFVKNPTFGTTGLVCRSNWFKPNLTGSNHKSPENFMKADKQSGNLGANQENWWRTCAYS